MVYDYLITLMPHNPKPANIISLLLYITACIVFLLFAINQPSPGVKNFTWPVILLAYLVIMLVRNKRSRQARYSMGLLIAAVAWLLSPNGHFWLAALYGLSAFAEREYKFDREIGFSENEIMVNTLIKKRYSWTDLTNVVIKDGILTLDFKNNKLMQHEIATSVPNNIEQEFNDFCRRQIIRAQSALQQA